MLWQNVWNSVFVRMMELPSVVLTLKLFCETVVLLVAGWLEFNTDKSVGEWLPCLYNQHNTISVCVCVYEVSSQNIVGGLACDVAQCWQYSSLWCCLWVSQQLYMSLCVYHSVKPWLSVCLSVCLCWTLASQHQFCVFYAKKRHLYTQC